MRALPIDGNNEKKGINMKNYNYVISEAQYADLLSILKTKQQILAYINETYSLNHPVTELIVR